MSAAPGRPQASSHRSAQHEGTPVSGVFDAVRIGIVSVSDRASAGVYVDKGLPALKDWLTRALHHPLTFEERLIPDE